MQSRHTDLTTHFMANPPWRPVTMKLKPSLPKYRLSQGEEGGSEGQEVRRRNEPALVAC